MPDKTQSYFRILLFLICSLCCQLTAQAQGDNNWVWQTINIDTLHKAFIPKQKIKIAIIDGAMDIDHPLIRNYIAHNEKEIAGNNIDDDKNGLIDDCEGWDFGDNDNDVRTQGNNYSAALHATRVADVFLQTLNQLIPEAEKYISILPLKAHTDAMHNNYINVGYRAIQYAIEQKADIIICSWGGTMVNDTQKNILQKAADAGIVIVATAGNFFFNTPQYPGAYDPVICVAALSKNNTKQPVSDYGPFVDITAPGDSIFSIQNKTENRNGIFSGTSAAAPVVAAVIAALKTTGTKLSITDIDRLLKNSAEPLDEKNPLYIGKLGAGKVNVAKLKMLVEGKDEKRIYLQPKAYINLQKSVEGKNVAIKATGKFKDYKFLLKSPPEKSNATTIHFISFKDGRPSEKNIKKHELIRPFYLDADSIFISANGKIKSPMHLYYEAETIDSSFFYCSGITKVNDTAGYIEDGSGDDNYTGRNDCKWLITVPQGKRIAFDFVEFDTEPKLDNVYIFNGEGTETPILAIFSGHKIPPHVISWYGTALVWFVTNETINGKGWKLHYKMVDEK